MAWVAVPVPVSVMQAFPMQDMTVGAQVCAAVPVCFGSWVGARPAWTPGQMCASMDACAQTTSVVGPFEQVAFTEDHVAGFSLLPGFGSRLEPAGAAWQLEVQMSCSLPKTESAQRAEKEQDFESVGSTTPSGSTSPQSSGSASPQSSDVETPQSAGVASSAEVSPVCPLEPACSLRDLVNDPHACSRATDALRPEGCISRRIFRWIRPRVRELAMSKHGTRLVQRLLDVLGPGDFETLVTDLTFCTVELYQDPWGNHALTKMIEKSAFSLMSPVIERIAEEGPVKVAKHKFGCRVFDRLFEQAAEKDMTGLLMTGLIDPLVDAVETLSVHKFGNFVIQKLLEHGSDSNRSRIMQALLPSLPRLAFLKTASNVAQSVLSFCNPEEQRAIAETFLGAEARYGLEALAVDRFGSYVVEDLLGSDLAHISGVVSDRFTEAPEVYSAHLAVIAARGAKQKEP